MSTNFDYLIVGAGAAGLFAAVLLHQRGHTVCVLDKKAHASTHSRSIGIHPPSLHLLDEAGLLPAFIQHGRKVTQGRAIVTSVFSDDHHQIIRNRVLHLGSGDGGDMVLVVPQNITERLLEQALPPNTVRWGFHVTGFQQDANSVRVRVQRGQDDTLEFSGRYMLAADGMYSDVRTMAGVTWEGKTYKWPFCMGDFPDTTEFGDQAVIYLTPEGLVESFPLPGGLRRWVINVHPDTVITDDNSADGRWHRAAQAHEPSPDGPEISKTTGAQSSESSKANATSSGGPALSMLINAVHRRTGYQLHPADASVFSSFRAHRFSAGSSVNKRIILLGDAAHVISPIGGQGMNFGWMNIRTLVDIIEKQGNLNDFNRIAAKNARKFGSRAHFNTLVGLPGKHPKILASVTDLLLSAPLRGLFVRRFTMR